MDNCIFCKIARHQSRAWMVHETDASCAFLDVNPMNPYHTLVIPKRHCADIFSMPTEGLQELMGTLKSVVDLYDRQLNLMDVQIISSNGPVAQQDVFHLHFHIAPRYKDDGQNVVWKTMPALRDEYDRMLERLGRGR